METECCQRFNPKQSTCPACTNKYGKNYFGVIAKVG